MSVQPQDDVTAQPVGHRGAAIRIEERPAMLDPQGAFDLRQFPRDQRERFFTSVLRGKNQMPPWGDILKPAEVEALWGYVVAGEK